MKYILKKAKKIKNGNKLKGSPIIDRAFIAGWSALQAELYLRHIVEPETELPELNDFLEEWKERQPDLTQVVPAKDGSTIKVSHPWMVLALAQSFAETVEQSGAENYLEIRFTHIDPKLNRPLQVVMQYIDEGAKTPAMVNAELREVLERMVREVELSSFCSRGLRRATAEAERIMRENGYLKEAADAE